MFAADHLPLDAHLCFSIYGAHQAFTRVYRPLLEPLGLTYPQYLAMVTLWAGDGISVGALGEKMGLDSGTLTPLLKRLEARKLIRRVRSRADGRVVEIKLTAAGYDLKEQARDIPRQVACATGLELSDLGQLRGALRRLARGLNAAADAQETTSLFPQE